MVVFIKVYSKNNEELNEQINLFERIALILCTFHVTTIFYKEIGSPIGISLWARAWESQLLGLPLSSTYPEN